MALAPQPADMHFGYRSTYREERAGQGSIRAAIRRTRCTRARRLFLHDQGIALALQVQYPALRVDALDLQALALGLAGSLHVARPASGARLFGRSFIQDVAVGLLPERD